MRYPRVGGTRSRRFDGINFEPRKLPENAATPTRRVHAVLARFMGFPLTHWFEDHIDNDEACASGCEAETLVRLQDGMMYFSSQVDLYSP